MKCRGCPKKFDHKLSSEFIQELGKASAPEAT
jgi:hypothetical protein